MTSNPIFDAIVKPNSMVFDVGANVGNKAQEFLDRGARVVCFEPQPQCVAALQSRFAQNSNVMIEPIGLGEKERTAMMHFGQADTLSTLSAEFIRVTARQRFRGHRWTEPRPVPISTLDLAIGRHGKPDYCKIDVEGYEFGVLCGLSQPLPMLSIEFTPELKEQTHRCIERLLMLNPAYEFNYSEGESGHFHFPEWVGPYQMWAFLQANNDFEVSFGDVYARC